MKNVTEERNTEPLRARGEYMIKLLRDVEMDTLEQIAEDIRPMDFTNAEIIRTVEVILESRRRRLIEEGDTLSTEDVDE